MDDGENMDASLKQTLESIEKQFGKGSIMCLGDPGVGEPMEVIPTGSLSLDLALGVGGYPRGRVVEVYGPESSGKTSITLHCIAQAQKMGLVAAFVDAEHALNPQYAAKLGVKTSELILSQPDSGEQALEITDKLVSSGKVDLVVVDSVAALVPQAEIDGEMTDIQPGLQARLMSKALRKITASIARSSAVVIFINQLRHKIGVMFGNPEVTTGGNALKFYSSVRLDIRRISVIKEKDKAIGNQIRVKVVKNKVAPPFRQIEVEMLYESGICKLKELVTLGVSVGLVHKSGSWYSYKDKKMGQGLDQAAAYLKDNFDSAEELEKGIMDEAAA